jgi:hypothetical protein
MVMMVLAAVLTLGTVTAETDTTLKVRSGTRLLVDNFGGEIAIHAWDKNALRVQATHSARIRVFVEEAGPNIQIRASSRRGIPGRVDYRISAPAWMPLQLSGVYTDVAVEGSKNEVSVETVKGDVRLHGGEGLIKLSSIQGGVSVIGARGRLELSSVNEAVSVNDSEGELSVEAVNGDVTLDGVRSRMIEVATVNGEVRFLGRIDENGRYKFSSHNGDLDVAVPDNVNATVSVATFNGEFESTFPVVLSGSGKSGKRFTFRLGGGSALIDLETFMGTINLRRANDAAHAKEK